MYALCVYSNWKCSPIYIGRSYIVLLYTIMYSTGNYFKFFLNLAITCFICLQGLIQQCRSNVVLSDVRRITTTRLAAMSLYFDFRLMTNVVVYRSERYLEKTWSLRRAPESVSSILRTGLSIAYSIWSDKMDSVKYVTSLVKILF